jgi:hydrogenase/urease accessory protein HupE
VIPPAGLERDLLIVACAISAGIHGALTPEHFAEATGAGLGFLASAALLLGLVVALTRRPDSTAALAVAALVLAGLLASYALATTTGLPLLHPDAEPVTGLALATKVIETVGLLAAGHLLWRGRPAVAVTHPRPKGQLS